MSQPLRVAVADDEPDMRDYFRRVLPRLGHKVIVVAENGKDLVEQCLRDWPDIVITDIKMPEMDGIDAATALYRRQPVPVVLVSAYHSPDFIERAEQDHVLGYLVKPIKSVDLEPALALTMRRFRQFEELRKETADLRLALRSRPLVERATALLMHHAAIDEEEAFRRLRELAARKSRGLADIAEMVVVAEEARTGIDLLGAEDVG